jgi:hypothetical protein
MKERISLNSILVFNFIISIEDIDHLTPSMIIKIGLVNRNNQLKQVIFRSFFQFYYWKLDD